MRVAIVSLFTPEHGSTPARERTHRIASGLTARGHDVAWFCARWWGGDHARFEEDGIKYRSVVIDPSPSTFAARLPLALRRFGPDVVHTVNTPPTTALAATLTGPIRRVPVVVDWWRDHPDDDAGRYRRLTRRADCITTPSRTTKTYVREHGAHGDVVTVIPESVDMDLIDEAAVDDRFDVVYARRLDRHANVESLLLALAELRGRDLHAAVIGDGPERPRIEAIANDLRLNDQVTFLGEQPLESRVSICKGTHVVAGTATWETFPTELLWALACGCVGLVEYQAASSAHELVEGRHRGRLVTSPAELADAIVEVSEFDRQTIDDTFERYDHSAVLDQYVDCYRTLVDDT